MQHIFKKKFGQNFLTDKNLLNAIVNDGDVDENDNVVEIGAGMGGLTKALSQKAKMVKSYEIDTDLKDFLLALNLPNTTFIFKDVMAEDMESIEGDIDGDYRLVANLPYYITTPLIFKFLSQSKKMKSLTIMVQKEVALRMCAKYGKDHGVLSIMTDFYGNATIKRMVTKDMFTPKPKVDSALVHLDVNRNKYPGIPGEKFFKFVQNAFAMRRKTLKNNLLSAGVSEKKLVFLSPEDLSKRPEEFTTRQFVDFYLKIFA